MATDEQITTKANEVAEEAAKQLAKEFGGLGFGRTSGSTEEWAAYIASIPGQFQYFTDRDPESFTSLIAELDEVKRLLGSGVTGLMAQAADDVGDWQGDGALKFNQNVLLPFDTIRDNQIAVAEELRRALQCQQKIVDSLRNDVLMIGDRTLEALKKLDDDDGGPKKGLLTVAAAVGAMLAATAAVATGGGIPIALAIIGGLISAGATAYGEYSEVEIGGETVAAVLGSMSEAFDTLRKATTQQEKLLGDALKGDIPVVDAALTATVLDFGIVPLRPAFVDDPDPGEFRPPVEAT